MKAKKHVQNAPQATQTAGHDNIPADSDKPPEPRLGAGNGRKMSMSEMLGVKTIEQGELKI